MLDIFTLPADSTLALAPNLTLVPLLAVVAGAFFLAGSIKGVLGLGMPAIAMVLLTLFLPPLLAIPVVALPTALINVVQYGRARPYRLMVASRYGWCAVILAVVISTTGYFITAFPEAFLLLALGIAMVIFAVQSLMGVVVRISSHLGWQVLAGSVAGVIGGLSAVFSPPIVMYLIARDTPKQEFIAATGFLFLSGCAPLVVALAVNSVLVPATIVLGLFGLLAALAGFLLGEWVRGYIAQDLFRRLIMLFFLIMGGRLILVSLL